MLGKQKFSGTHVTHITFRFLPDVFLTAFEFRRPIQASSISRESVNHAYNGNIQRFARRTHSIKLVAKRHVAKLLLFLYREIDNGRRHRRWWRMTFKPTTQFGTRNYTQYLPLYTRSLFHITCSTTGRCDMPNCKTVPCILYMLYNVDYSAFSALQWNMPCFFSQHSFHTRVLYK